MLRPTTDEPAPVDGVILVQMTHADLDQVLAIERESFASPWQREHFEHELHDNRFSVNRVAKHGDAVVGYASVWHLEGELRINNIAIHPDCRRHGLGRWLLAALLAEARDAGCSCATLEVRVSNAAARELYARAGFREVGRRANYYQREAEDAVLMSTDL